MASSQYLWLTLDFLATVTLTITQFQNQGHINAKYKVASNYLETFLFNSSFFFHFIWKKRISRSKVNQQNTDEKSQTIFIMVKAFVLLWDPTNSHPLSISLDTTELMKTKWEKQHRKLLQLHSFVVFCFFSLSSLLPSLPQEAVHFLIPPLELLWQENFAVRNVLLDTGPDYFQLSQWKEARISSHFNAPPPPSLLIC